MLPARRAPSGVSRPILRWPKVTVSSACTAMPSGAPLSASRPEGMSSATQRASAWLRAAMTSARWPADGAVEAGAEEGVDHEVGAAPAPPPAGARDAPAGSSVKAPPRSMYASWLMRRVAHDLLGAADEEDLDLGAAREQVARHHEAVAAVVARAADHHDARVERVGRGLPRRLARGAPGSRACARSSSERGGWGAWAGAARRLDHAGMTSAAPRPAFSISTMPGTWQVSMAYLSKARICARREDRDHRAPPRRSPLDGGAQIAHRAIEAEEDRVGDDRVADVDLPDLGDGHDRADVVPV